MDQAFHPRDPRSVAHPRLRELAIAAATVAKLEETEAELVSLTAVTHEHDDNAYLMDEWEAKVEAARKASGNDDEVVEVEGDHEWWKLEALMVAQRLAEERWYDEHERLEAEAAAWLAADDANWPLFRSVAFDDWEQAPGVSKENAPRWAVVLGGLHAVSGYGAVPYAPRPWVARNQIRNDQLAAAY